MQRAAPLLNLVGKAAAATIRDKRFQWINHSLGERLCRAIHPQSGVSALPSSFLLEVYNPESSPMNLAVAISPVATASDRNYVQISASYRTTMVLPRGYSRHELDYRLIRKVVEGGSFDISLTPEGDTKGRLVFLTADFVRHAPKPQAQRQAQVKCVVWDLDNTLWNGVLLEGTTPEIRTEALSLIRFLDERGILLSVASKNDADTALAALRAYGLAEYFLYPQINWNPKSNSIRRIAELLNIGADTLAFIDDSPFEREEVANSIDGILCIDSADITSLAADPRFQGSASPEARRRRQLYQEAIHREEEEKRYGADYVAFLRTCDIRLYVDTYGPDDFDRAAELVQRTNQLNFSGRKYTREQLVELVEAPGVQKYVLRCSDRYGSYGTIGFALIRPGQAELLVDDFMLSCRVQGKFLEQAFLAHILAQHNPLAATAIRVNYKNTSKNTPARKVLQSIGFTVDDRPGMVTRADAAVSCDFISISCSSCDPPAGGGPESLEHFCLDR